MNDPAFNRDLARKCLVILAFGTCGIVLFGLWMLLGIPFGMVHLHGMCGR